MNGTRLPPFAVIAAALRATTERLTREVASPLESAPPWNAFEWSVARAVSALHGISGLLATRLRWQGPPDWAAFLRDQREQSLACHERIGQVLAQVDRVLADAGVACVALKGSAVREHRVHHAGERPMGDIDLLARPADVARMIHALGALGYVQAFVDHRHITLMPAQARTPDTYGEHVGNPLRIEIHERVTEELPADSIDITDELWPREPKPGINPYASFTALTRHVMLHTAGNMRAHAMRFLQIYEIAQLARRLGPADWAELLGDDARARAWWIYPALTLAERYVPDSIPDAQLQAFAAACPRGLRERFERHSVYDVSWSNLRIHALPGIEWSRTWSEALRFARSRALPSRAALRELHDGLEALPHLTQGRWYRATHAERIARWLFSRPARVQTLCSVRAALAEASAPFETDRTSSVSGSG
jgi:hypothetical protein